MNEQILNAQIKSASFGYCEHGILTFEIRVDASDDNYYIFGQYALDQPDKEAGERRPTKEGFECLVNTMNVVGVSKWEDLPGKYVRIKVSDSNKGSYVGISAIGNLLKDEWFDLEDHFASCR